MHRPTLLLLALVIVVLPSACRRGRDFAATDAPTAARPQPTARAAGLSEPKVTLLVGQGGRVSWSPAQDWIAFDTGKADKSDVYIARLDGSDKRCLTCDKKGLPQLHNGNPEWHPSGNFIVFQAQDPGLSLPALPLSNFVASPGIGINNNLWIMNAEGSRFWQVTRVRNRSGVLHPQFSPDGKRLLWSEISTPGGDLGGQWVIQLADFTVVNAEPRVTNIQTLTPGNLELYETHGFSPDNRKIIFSGVPRGKYYYDMEIFSYELATKKLTRLTENDEWDEHAHYSPDGKWIAWMSSADIPQVHSKSIAEMSRNPLKTDAWIMDADGSNKRRLTRLNGPSAAERWNARDDVIVGDISWAPDSQAFVAKIQVGRDESIVLVEFAP